MSVAKFNAAMDEVMVLAQQAGVAKLPLADALGADLRKAVDHLGKVMFAMAKPEPTTAEDALAACASHFCETPCTDTQRAMFHSNLALRNERRRLDGPKDGDHDWQKRKDIA